jgi:hypothetical protein
VTSSRPETEASEEAREEATAEEQAEAPHPLTGFAQAVGDAVGGEASITYDTVKVGVEPDRWVETLTTARDEFDLVRWRSHSTRSTSRSSARWGT